MESKIAVQFRKLKKSTYTFQRLKYCKKCGRYSVLFDEICPDCQSSRTFQSPAEHAYVIHKRSGHTETLLLIALLCLGIVLARDFTQLIAAFSAAVVLLTAYLYLLKRYRVTNEKFYLQKLLIKQVPQIAAGLNRDVESSLEDIKASKFKEGYEKLREIGYFLNNDHIKAYKIFCLSRFFIRKDMQLELETLIPGHFDKLFISYLFEVSQVNKQLIRQSVLDYVVKYRAEIEGLENGKEIMTNVAAAAIRMRHYVDTYSSMIFDYVEGLPKERFLRLCKMLAEHPSLNTVSLSRKCKETVRVRYGFDPDFQGIW
ncbi:hypothetical protein DFP98_1125 [Cohnella phaseoli]|uniref:Uncharacterized protein n=1 Tax=Cohnella phaseoli TaxID=456490 RepID=A0A3D9JQI5_9BACL|nr:hypothetical protein DFP98_1125 [Cohnella phaseoli]